jgi:uncharacterized membrane protein YgcG
LLARSVSAALVAVLVAAVATPTACRPAPASPSSDETTGSSTGGTEPPAATTFAGPDACQSSEECETEALCVAPYDPGSDPPMGQGGCIEACIEIDDLTRWCFDDASCCGNARCHVVDGLCEPGPSATGTSTSDDGGSTNTSSGSTSSGSTSSGSGTSSGSTSSSTSTG